MHIGTFDLGLGLRRLDLLILSWPPSLRTDATVKLELINGLYRNGYDALNNAISQIRDLLNNRSGSGTTLIECAGVCAAEDEEGDAGVDRVEPFDCDPVTFRHSCLQV